MQNNADNISNQTIELGTLVEASPVSFSMDTVGWKVLFGMLGLFLVWLLYRFYISYKRNAYRRTAVLKIKQLAQAHQNSDASLISEIMFQLKQTALKTYNRTEVASLKGLQWLQFLDEKGKTTHFSKNEKVIKGALYSNQLDKVQHFNSAEFTASSITWIKKHA